MQDEATPRPKSSIAMIVAACGAIGTFLSVTIGVCVLTSRLPTRHAFERMAMTERQRAMDDMTSAWIDESIRRVDAPTSPDLIDHPLNEAERERYKQDK